MIQNNQSDVPLLKFPKTTYGGKRASVEDTLLWKMTFGGRRPSVEDDLRWKMTFGGRRPSVEDDFWWKRTFGGRRPLVEDNLQWKTTFANRLKRWPLVPKSQIYQFSDLHFLCLWNITDYFPLFIEILLSSPPSTHTLSCSWHYFNIEYTTLNSHGIY